jgi:abequosyltransferase
VTKLSICIATFGRGEFIAETLDSIVPQLTSDVELVIVEGHSPDHTASIVGEYAQNNSRIRYFREPVNSGVDADYNKAVLYADGEYCWLFTDDDLLGPAAVSRVLDVLMERPDLLVVDAAVMDVTLSTTLRPRRMKFTGMRRYDAGRSDDAMKDLGEATSYIGSVVICREVWIARDHQSFVGTLFAHVGVIFQLPKLASVIGLGESLISIRLGNAMWTPRRFEIWAFKWPQLIWSFDGYSDAAKSSLGSRFVWRSPTTLFSFRAKGAYSYREYRRYFDGEKLGIWRLAMWVIAILPGRVAHVIGTSYIAATGQLGDMGGYDLLHSSPFVNPVSRWIARIAVRIPRIGNRCAMERKLK